MNVGARPSVLRGELVRVNVGARPSVLRGELVRENSREELVSLKFSEGLHHCECRSSSICVERRAC